MLAVGIAFVALRRRSLYTSQLPSRRDSPAHRDSLLLDALDGVKVRDVMTRGKTYASFQPATPAAEVVRRVSDLPWQDVFPVIDGEERLVGMITSEGLRILAGARELEAISVAADVMQPPVVTRPDDDARVATQALLASGLPEIPVVDEAGKVCGFLEDSEVARAYVRATTSRAPGR
jgi:CIC family chloride channel protein